MDTEVGSGLIAIAVIVIEGFQNIFFFDFVKSQSGDNGVGWQGGLYFFGQVLAFNQALSEQDEAAFDDIFQFPDVAGEGVIHQGVQGGI